MTWCQGTAPKPLWEDGVHTAPRRGGGDPAHETGVRHLRPRPLGASRSQRRPRRFAVGGQKRGVPQHIRYFSEGAVSPQISPEARCAPRPCGRGVGLGSTAGSRRDFLAATTWHEDSRQRAACCAGRGAGGSGGRAAWTAEEEELVPGTRGFCFSVGCGLGFAFLFSEEAEGGRGRRVRTELRARHSRGPQAQAGMSLPGGSAPERGESRERVVLALLARSRRNLQRQGFRRPAEPPPPGAQRCRLTTGTFPACGKLGEQVGRCRWPTAAHGGPAGDTSFVFKKLRQGLLDGVTDRSPGRRSEGRRPHRPGSAGRSVAPGPWPSGGWEPPASLSHFPQHRLHLSGFLCC